jgi:FtsP/CotA-like multicopper oxidase with cupredoxin domain
MRRPTGITFLVVALGFLLGASPAFPVRWECPEDLNGDGIRDIDIPGVECRHLAAGDGMVTMGDGTPMYIFGFADVTDQPLDNIVASGMLGANFSAPTLTAKEGEILYLTVTNVGMVLRPDLFDAHSVHWHGFPNAAAVFDGLPDASIAVRMGASLSYFYKVVTPGTFMYHCHVEVVEHMQMGMLGNLYVRPIQDDNATLLNLGTTRPVGNLVPYAGFAYNDNDGTTGYDVAYPIQIAAFDPAFHNQSEDVQPLPFAAMDDKYPMLNGRGYPDTVNPAPIVTAPMDGVTPSQRLSALITAAPGQRILLRISSLSTTSFHTLESAGIPMRVVGRDASLLRGPSLDNGITPGIDLSYDANSVTVGGGQSTDVLLQIPQIPFVVPGETTYFLYVRELEHMNNDKDRFGGMMTEIRVQ